MCWVMSNTLKSILSVSFHSFMWGPKALKSQLGSHSTWWVIQYRWILIYPPDSPEQTLLALLYRWGYQGLRRKAKSTVTQCITGLELTPDFQEQLWVWATSQSVSVKNITAWEFDIWVITTKTVNYTRFEAAVTRSCSPQKLNLWGLICLP